MEEKELTKRLYDMFDATIPVIENIEKGFMAQNQTLLNQAETKFLDLLTTNLLFFENIISDKQKDDVEMKFLHILVPLQRIALALRGLIAKKKTILMRDVVLSVKAITEITELLAVMKQQLIDTRDVILSKDPVLKESIRKGMERIIEMAERFMLAHEQRLVTGVCMPKASYLYLDIISSSKRITRELVNFSERI